MGIIIFAWLVPESWAKVEQVLMEHARKCVTTGKAITDFQTVCSLISEISEVPSTSGRNTSI